MFKNNIKMALRALVPRWGYTLINLVGLAVGIAASLIVLLYLSHEFSYDTQHEDIDRLHRLIRHVRPGGGTPEYDARGAQWRAWIDLPSEIPEIEAAAGFFVRPMWAPARTI